MPVKNCMTDSSPSLQIFHTPPQTQKNILSFQTELNLLFPKLETKVVKRSQERSHKPSSPEPEIETRLFGSNLLRGGWRRPLLERYHGGGGSQVLIDGRGLFEVLNGGDVGDLDLGHGCVDVDVDVRLDGECRDHDDGIG